MICLVPLILIVTSIIPFGVARLAASTSSDQSSTIIEANKLLEEEVKAAARPQIYLIMDLASSTLTIKSRGVELKRYRIQAWSTNGDRSVNGSYRLRARPPVNRPKAAPADERSVPAIELQHMPDRYELVFDPNLTITIHPADEPAWIHAKNAVNEWWDRVSRFFRTGATPDRTSTVTVNMMLDQEGARSLAWTVTDGMLLLVGPTALP